MVQQKTRGLSMDDAVLTAPPGDPVFEVWADALIQAGNPRGELVSLCRRLEEAPENEELKRALDVLVQANREAWCPGCADDESGSSLTLGWRDGFVDTVNFSPEPLAEHHAGYGGEGEYDEDEEGNEGPGAGLHRLIDLPTGARISSISVRCPIDAEGNHGCWGSHEAFMDRLLARDRPWLRALEIDPVGPQSLEHGRRIPELSFLLFGVMHEAEIAIGDMSTLWKRAPRLEHLVIHQPDKIDLGTIDAPNLRTLVFGSTRGLQTIARGNLPRLETLIVRVDNAAQVKLLLESKTIGSLKTLGLITLPNEPQKPRGDGILRAIADSPRIADLETLDIGGLEASDAGWESFIGAASRFRRLETLRVTTWEIDPDTEIDDWLEESVEPRRAASSSPRRQPIGRRLEETFPVHWLRVAPYSIDGEPPEGTHVGLFDGQEGFAEART